MDNNSPYAEQEKTEQTKQQKTNKSSLKPIGWGLLLIIVLLPGLLALWFLYQQQQTLTNQAAKMDKEIPALQQSLRTMDNDQRDIRNMLDKLQQDEKSQQQAIQELQEREPMSDAQLQLQWALKEVNYLLQIANQRATLANDGRGASQALQLADEKLQQVDDYRLQDLREQIADEQMALDGLTETDISGMAADLLSAVNAIDRLRVVKGPRQYQTDPMADTGADLTTPSGWQQALTGIWQEIRSLVVIRQQEDASEAVLIPEQRYFLYQNLRLKLETARFALLSGKQSVFDSSLQTAIDWLEKYFTGSEQQAMLETLRSVQSRQIEINMPDISESLRMLQDFEP